MRRAVPLVLAVATALALAPAASARTYDVPAWLGAELGRAAERSGVPVRVPAALPLDFAGRLFPSGSATSGRWSLRLDATRRCAAGVCSLARMTGVRGGRLVFRRRVALALGITGRLRALTCRASCTPPIVEWRQGGSRFRIQARLGVAGASAQRAALVRAANSAIRRRPR